MSNLKQYIENLPEDLREKVKSGVAMKDLLNANPPAKWIARHPLSGHSYLPIDKVETMLDLLFQTWTFEIVSISESADMQSVVAVIILKVIGYDGTERTMPGVGAAPIQRGKETGEILADARQKAYPAAISFAIKDAAEHLGKVFGRDVNRKDVLDWQAISKRAYGSNEDIEDIKSKLREL
ncbi:MAG: Rad52/Rad22 family DNA repair protein [Candidatus Anstonellaceae archaeon]